MRKGFAAVTVAALLATACSETQPLDRSLPLVVVTTSILGDVTSEIAGELARVEVLMPVGVDPHDFQLSSAKAALLRQARVVIANGLGLEEGIEDALQSAAADGVRVLELAPHLNPLPFGFEAQDEHQEDSHGDLDPHFWHDPIRMVEAVHLIATELSDLGPGIGQRAKSYVATILDMHAELSSLYASIPLERRVLVTNHDSFGYLADRYELSIAGVVIPGGSTLSEPSSAELADLIATIRTTNAPAIFTETVSKPALAEALAKEIGNNIEIVTLYSDSLGGPGSEVESYLEMMRYNARSITEALRP